MSPVPPIDSAGPVLARRMARFVLAAILAIVIAGGVFGGVLISDPARMAGQFPQLDIDPAGIGLAQRLLIGVVNGATLALTLYGLVLLHRVFDRIAHGAEFDPETGHLVRLAGQVFLGAALYAVVARVATSALVTLGNPPGLRSVTIGVTMNDLLAAIFAGSVICLGHVLLKASALDDENKSFV